MRDIHPPFGEDRVYHRILGVARTIADLEGAERLERAHVAEAAAYRLAF